MRNGFGIILGLWVLALGGYIWWQNSQNATDPYVRDHAEKEWMAKAIAAKEEMDKYIPDEYKFEIKDIVFPDKEILKIAENREWADAQIAIDNGKYENGKARYLGNGNYEFMRNNVDSMPVNVKRGIMKYEFDNLEGPKIWSKVIIEYCFDDYYIKVKIKKGMTSWKYDNFGNKDKRTIQIDITSEVTKETYSK